MPIKLRGKFPEELETSSINPDARDNIQLWPQDGSNVKKRDEKYCDRMKSEMKGKRLLSLWYILSIFKFTKITKQGLHNLFPLKDSNCHLSSWQWIIVPQLIAS